VGGGGPWGSGWVARPSRGAGRGVAVAVGRPTHQSKKDDLVRPTAMLASAVIVLLLPAGLHAFVAPRGLPTTQNRARHSTQGVILQQSSDVTDAVLTGNGLTQTFDGATFQFAGIDMVLPRGTKSGLVGVNGAGKSSLLKVLAGTEQPESGSVSLASGLRMAYVEQDPALPAGASAAEFVFMSDTPAVRALRTYNAAVNAADADTSGEALAAASSAMDAAGAWELEGQMVRLCTSLRVGHLLDRPAESLSGGERKRVALAAALLAQPDLLLLDEPTNHLDIDAIRWLERELTSRRQLTLLVVTHDRAFLSAACDEILELDRAALHCHSRCRTYDDFLEKKQARLEAAAQQEAADRNLLRKELAWVRKQPKARESKSKVRAAAYEELAAKVSKAKAGASTDGVQLQAEMTRLGTAVLTLVGASVDVGGRRLFSDLSCEMRRGDRIGIVGPNGAGKSSLLRAITQELPLASGELKQGETVVTGYYAQEGLVAKPDERVRAVVQEAVASGPGGGVSGAADEAKAFALLRQFLFPPARWNERVERLSGGERRRLQLLQVLAMQPNILLLDEPTNDLDLQTLQVLEEFLLGFAGVVLTVSHDRYFVDSVCKRLLVLPEDSGGEVLSWGGSFSEYLRWRDETEEKGGVKPQPPSTPSKGNRGGAGNGGDRPHTSDSKASKPLSAFEERQLEKLEEEVEALTAQRRNLEKQVSGFDPSRDGYSDLQDWNDALEALGPKLEEAEEKWLALAERA
jgi:ATP-binding cassette subfamily F protein uup